MRRLPLLVALGGAVAACGGNPNASWDPPTSTAAPGRSSAVQSKPTSLDEAMHLVPITMYMTTWCPVCRRARGWLKSEGYDFVEFDVETNPRAGRILRSLNPRGTIPMFDVDGRILIGFEPTMLEDMIRRAAEERLAG
jgi:glutaredoxin